MKKLTYVILIFAFVAGILNFTALPIMVGIEPIIHVYKYEDENGKEIIEVPEKGSKINFEDTNLKRRFKKNYFKVWKWREYLTHERWKTEYYR